MGSKVGAEQVRPEASQEVSFGKRPHPDASRGDFKALFEAIEPEQENRGTL